MSSISSFLRISCGAAALLAFALPASAQINIGASNTAFTDISATGTSVGASADDAEFTVTGAQLTAAGFTGNGLLAGGVDIRIGNNGALIWNDNASEVGYTNSEVFPTMPASNAATVGNGGLSPHQFICPLWDDQYPAAGLAASCIHWKVVGTNLIVQWSNEDHFGFAGTGSVQFQVIVYSGVTIASGSPLVEFVYNDTTYGAGALENDGGSATIGFKDWGVNASANDVEFGVGGGTTVQPKVGGWTASQNATLPHSVVIKGGPSAPSAPTLVAPANNATTSNPVTLSWNPSALATFYDVDVDGVVTTPVNGTSLLLGPLAGGLHTWKVRGENGVGAGPYSAPWTFTIVPPPPPSVCSTPMGGGGPVPPGQPATSGGTGAVWPNTLTTDVLDVPLVVTVPSGSTQITAVKLHGLTHTWVGDLQFVLEDPTGTWFNIFYRPLSVNNSVGLNCDLAGDYNIYETAGQVMGNASCAAGDYSQAFGDWPSGSANPPILNTLLSGITINGASNGTWILHVYDWAGGDVGTLTNWELCFNAPTGPAVYCTAGTSSNGCVPSISASAQPSVTLAHPCSISIANLEGQKFGIVFYGVNNTGFSPTPWANGSNSFLCVKGPTQRTGTGNSGGTILQCNGALTLNWNTYQTNNPGSVGNPFAAGNHVYVQGWYRDPPAPKTTNLSNALDMTMTP